MGNSHLSDKSSFLCKAISLLLVASCSTCTECADQQFHKSYNGEQHANSAAQQANASFTGSKAQLHSKSKSGHDSKFQLHGNVNRSAKKRRNSRKWLHDSGASVHCCSDKSLFHSFDANAAKPYLRVANGEYVQVEQVGNVVLTLQNQHGKYEQILLTNVAYTPTFHQNILSVSRLWHENRIQTKFGRRCYLKSDNGSKFLLDTDTSPYTLSANAVFAAQESFCKGDHALWHAKFMHAGPTKMQQLSKYIPSLSGYVPCQCEACVQGKMRRRSFTDVRRKFKRKQRVYTYFGERISTDLCGPFPESITDGCVYAIVFHDACTGRISTYYLQTKTKEEVLDAFKRFLSDNKHLLTKGVGEFHCDNGSEYVNSDMDAFCEEICVNRSFSVPYVPQQNPHAERAWSTLLTKVRVR